MKIFDVIFKIQLNQPNRCFKPYSLNIITFDIFFKLNIMFLPETLVIFSILWITDMLKIKDKPNYYTLSIMIS